MHSTALPRSPWTLTRVTAVALAAIVLAWPSPAVGQFNDTVPSQAYYAGIEQLYRGEYRDAVRIFKREWQGAVKTVNARWIDSICYHALLGETFYHQGDRAAALEQFNFAASMYLQYPDWLLQVRFDQPPRPDPSLARRLAPWGVSQRQSIPGDFSRQLKISQGRLDNSNAARFGGVVQQAQYWQINVVEILRCTALTIRRRNELLGPLAAHDGISKDVLSQLSKGGAPPNHWSGAWINVLRGLAHAGMGQKEQALARLQSGLLVAGQFDHPLTPFSLIEQGQLMMREGNFAAADSLLAEAGLSGYVFEDPHIIDEAFRLGLANRRASGIQGVHPALEACASWARRKRLNQIYCRVQLALAEELLAANNLDGAAAALGAASSQMRRDVSAGVLGNWALYQQARVEFAQGRDSAPATLAKAVGRQAQVTPRNLQISLANSMFDARTLSSRSAVEAYLKLLSDPTPADTAFRPLETLAVMSSTHDAAFGRWLTAVLERKNHAAAIQVADRAKRRRFHSALPWGGRLAAVRRLLAAPQESLTPELLQQQNDALARFPRIADSQRQASQARAELLEQWQPELDDEGRKTVLRVWTDYSDAIRQRELLLAQIGLSRTPADYLFPPVAVTAQIQARLQPGQAVMMFHDTPGGMLGFLFTNQASTQWNCGPSGRLGSLISAFLRDLGNYDANREVPAEELASDDWMKSSAKLYDALTRNSLFDPHATSELIVIPDGALWYVPFEALSVASEGVSDPLVSLMPIRYAPTAGLAFSKDGPWRRIQRTGLHIGELIPGENEQQQQPIIETLRAAVSGPIGIDDVPAASPTAASLLDWLIVLDDVETESPDPLAWSPVPIDRSPELGALAEWLTVTDIGPERIVLPAMHTPAERGGKASRRRASRTVPGNELFFASCTLLSAGAETVLLSRWRVGGQTMLDLTREFVQELPYSPAASAWQRSVQLTQQTPVDPLKETRVKASRDDPPLTASHPFFWAGYLVVDTGGQPPQPEAPPAEEEVAAN